MPSKLQRLFVKSKLAASVEIELNQAQANYLGNVLRLRESDELLLFNGSDGEWRASLGPIGKKRPRLLTCALDIGPPALEQHRLQRELNLGHNA